MKVALLLPGNYWYSPYVSIYEDILNENAIEYDVISWDRDGLNDNNVISFKLLDSQESNRIKKGLNYFKYRRFIIQHLNNTNYDKIIVFGPQLGIFLYSFLRRKYYKNFFLDYRDVSIDQYFQRTFKKLLSCSSGIAISSPGFLKVLPRDFNYLISHNFRFKLIDNTELEGNNIRTPFCDEIITISTIGAIRDIDANMQLVTSLKNNVKYKIQFIGKGSDVIAKNTVGVNNIEFHGFYDKSAEADFILNCDFLNIYYPDIITHSTALSNRFYNAIIYKRPMIVTTNSIQGDYVEQYNLGISTKSCENLDKQITEYVGNFSFELFSNECDQLIDKFKEDYEIFEQALLCYLNR